MDFKADFGLYPMGGTILQGEYFKLDSLNTVKGGHKIIKRFF